MGWWIIKTYVGVNERVLQWLSDERRAYFDLRPPAVPVRILSAADLTVREHQKEFSDWALQAKLIEPEDLMNQLRNGLGEIPPDRQELLQLKWFAEHFDVPVADYAASMFGGQIDWEWCWEFGPNERVLINARPDLLEFKNGMCRSEAGGSDMWLVLKRMLETFGIASNGYFKPHTRGFNWNSHLVSPRPRWK